MVQSIERLVRPHTKRSARDRFFEAVLQQVARDSRIEYKHPHELYPLQRKAIYCGTRYTVIEASTKSGKTVGCMAWLLDQAVQGPAGGIYWWVAPTWEMAKRLAWYRYQRQYRHGLFKSNASELTLTLPNDAALMFRGSDRPDTLYGEDVRAAVVDEASRVKEDAWFAVRSTLTATKGPVRIIGNVKGRKNWAYRMARQAEGGEPGMAYFRITAHDAVDAGVLDAEEIEDAERRLPDNVFRELFLAEASDDQGNPFGIDAIRECVLPLSDGKPVVWGWDLAKSHDWTVGIALNTGGRVCAFERFQKPWVETERRIVQVTGSTPALVDSTGVGDPVLEALQQNGRANFEGYKFTAASKQQLMEGLAVAIQRRYIGYPAGTIVNELESFEYEYYRGGVRYSAPEGLHDDCVCALALAVWKLNAGPAIEILIGRA